MQSVETAKDRRAGIFAVLQAASVSLATAVFLPGMLVRIGFQLLAATGSGMKINHRDFLTELGGEVSQVSGRSAWTRLMVATLLGPSLLGAVLLLPAVVRLALLDVRPFATISADPGLIVSHDTSLRPVLEAMSRYGLLGFLTLWFGISCFYCSVPSKALLDGAREESRRRRSWSPVRLVLGLVISFFRVLRVLDTLLTLGFAGSYLASGLLMLLLGWGLLTFAATAIF
jgi:hypothetical protein